MDIRFVTSSKQKFREMDNILSKSEINIIHIDYNIDELQTDNIEKLVKDKALKAFRRVGKPLIVEHTGLFIKSLNGFPAGLTQIFWDTIGADKFSSTFNNSNNKTIKAKTIIGYCDGKKIYFFSGVTKGTISKTVQGDATKLKWDTIFIPNGYNQTFAQMGKKKNKISMRRKAFDKLLKFIKEQSK